MNDSQEVTSICPACIHDFVVHHGRNALGSEPKDLRDKNVCIKLCDAHKSLNYFMELRFALDLTK